MITRMAFKRLLVLCLSTGNVIGSAFQVPVVENVTVNEIATYNDWVPVEAPLPLLGQNIFDYIDTILGGEGIATNDEIGLKKRDLLFGNHTKTTQWEDGLANFSITVIDDHCAGSLNPSYIAGDCLGEDGVTDHVDCTIKDIIDRLWDIRKAHVSLSERNQAYAALWHTWAAKAEAEWTDLLDNGWLCHGAIAHDELRRLQAIRNKYKYYSALLVGSAATGAVVAGVQVGITTANTDVNIGWVPVVNSAVGSAIIFFAATEFSRISREVSGGEAFAGITLWAWARRQARRSRSTLNRIASGTAATIGSAVSGGGNDGTGQQGEETELTCVTPEEAEAGLGRLADLADDGQQVLDLVSANEITTLRSGQLSSEHCN